MSSLKSKNATLFSRAFSKRSNTRVGGAIDTLVWIVAGILLLFWVIGFLFLQLYPSPEGSSNNGVAQQDSTGLNSGDDLAQTDLGSDDVSSEMQNDGTDGASNSNDGSSAKLAAAGDNTPQPTNDSADSNKKTRVTSGYHKTAPSNVDVTALKREFAAKHGAEISKLKKDHAAKLKKEQETVLRSFEKQSKQLQDGFRDQVNNKDKQITQLKVEISKLKRDLVTAKRSASQNASQLASKSTPPENRGAASTSRPSATNTTQSSTTSSLTRYPFRFWKSNRGSDAWLAFVRWEGGEIVLVDSNDELFKIPLNRLSGADQVYVQKLK